MWQAGIIAGENINNARRDSELSKGWGQIASQAMVSMSGFVESKPNNRFKDKISDEWIEKAAKKTEG